MSAAGVPAGVRIALDHARGDEGRLSVAAARLPAFFALASFGAYRWGAMVQPRAGAAMTVALLAGVGAGFALITIARRERAAGRRAVLVALVAAGLFVLAFAAAGVPARLAEPRSWDDLAAGIGQGLGAVPNVRVPYRGVDEWIRLVIVLGGVLLVAVAALLAFVPRRRGRTGFPFAAALLLGVLYLVPAMQRDTPNQFLAGGIFTVLLVLFLWLERVERRSAPIAAAVVALAILTALVAGPALDRAAPLVDYEQLAQSLSDGPSTRYDWNHSYGPLDWSRDGREVLRIAARERSYWKATNLSVFDGVRWRQSQGDVQNDLEGELQGLHPQWRQTLRVTVRALSSDQFIAAGTTIAIRRTPRTAVMRQPGVYSTSDRSLKRGNAYRADVYVPRPSARDLSAATRFDLPPGTDQTGFTTLELPQRDGDPASVTIPAWGQGDPGPRQLQAIARSPYERAYELARNLRIQSRTQYEYVRAVEEHLTRGFTYAEDPPPSADPLAEFLFASRAGYCQQFSGAMALLLRLGGVPARVGAGFSAGAYDAKRREYVVRDLDAHSWVEVYFPGLGWVTRDPTPGDSPARGQVADTATASSQPAAALPGVARPAPRQPEPENSGASGATVGTERDGMPVLWIAVAVAGGLAAIALLVIVLRRRRRRPAADDLGAEQLAELRRALARSGRPPAPDTTLGALAERWHGTPAEGYVRVLEQARYGYGGARPTAAQRAALRRELRLGLGLRGRLRSWWALPPWPPAPPRRRRATAERVVG